MKKPLRLFALNESGVVTLAPSAKKALQVLANSGQDPIETLSPQAAQSQYLSSFGQHQLPLENVDNSLEANVGQTRIRLWRGKDAPVAGARALLYLHGGGWVTGSPETHEDICRSIANRAQAVVISPDYALGPQHPYPGGLRSCAAVLSDIASNSGSYGIDPTQIAIGGDSAGGNLAAVLAIMARDRTVPDITAQLMLYPVTDCHQNTQSYTEKADGFGLTSAAMAWFRDHYLGTDGNVGDWRVSPLLAPALAGVAPAFIGLAGQDVLLSEGEAYAHRLETEAACITKRWPGQIHGFASLRGLIPEGDEAIDALVSAWNHFAPQRLT